MSLNYYISVSELFEELEKNINIYDDYIKNRLRDNILIKLSDGKIFEVSHDIIIGIIYVVNVLFCKQKINISDKIVNFKKFNIDISIKTYCESLICYIDYVFYILEDKMRTLDYFDYSKNMIECLCGGMACSKKYIEINEWFALDLALFLFERGKIDIKSRIRYIIDPCFLNMIFFNIEKDYFQIKEYKEELLTLILFRIREIYVNFNEEYCWVSSYIIELRKDFCYLYFMEKDKIFAFLNSDERIKNIKLEETDMGPVRKDNIIKFYGEYSKIFV